MENPFPVNADMTMCIRFRCGTGVYDGVATGTLMLSMAPDGRLRSMMFWMMGDLSGAQLRYLPWLVLIAALIFALRVARSINVLALYAETASTLGVHVGGLRKSLFFCSII